MEDFAIDLEKKNKDDGDLMNMQVSSFCNKNGERIAYVTFSDGKRSAEGEIPSCRIASNNGFSEEEIACLETYMKANLDMLKDMAKTVNPLKAFMK